MAQVQTVKANENINVINEILEKDGCIVIENVLSARQIEKLQSDLRPHFDQTPNCHGDFYGHVTKRMSSLIAKSGICQDMAIHPTILSVMDNFEYVLHPPLSQCAYDLKEDKRSFCPNHAA